MNTACGTTAVPTGQPVTGKLTSFRLLAPVSTGPTPCCLPSLLADTHCVAAREWQAVAALLCSPAAELLLG